MRGDGRVSVVDVLARELDVQDMRAIEPGRWLPLTRNVFDGKEHIDVRLENLFPSDGLPQAHPTWYPNSNTMALGIKLPLSQKKQFVRLRLSLWNSLETGENLSGTKVCFDAGHGDRIEIAEEGCREVGFLISKQAKDGVIWIRGHRENGFNSKIMITHIRVDEIIE